MKPLDIKQSYAFPSSPLCPAPLGVGSTTANSSELHPVEFWISLRTESTFLGQPISLFDCPHCYSYAMEFAAFQLVHAAIYHLTGYLWESSNKFLIPASPIFLIRSLYVLRSHGVFYSPSWIIPAFKLLSLVSTNPEWIFNWFVQFLSCTEGCSAGYVVPAVASPVLNWEE